MQPQGTAAVTYAGLLKRVGSADAASVVAAEVLGEKVATTLCVSEEDFGTSQPMTALSIDYLIAVEIRHRFASELKVMSPDFSSWAMSVLAKLVGCSEEKLYVGCSAYVDVRCDSRSVY